MLNGRKPNVKDVLFYFGPDVWNARRGTWERPDKFWEVVQVCLNCGALAIIDPRNIAEPLRLLTDEQRQIAESDNRVQLARREAHQKRI